MKYVYIVLNVLLLFIVGQEVFPAIQGAYQRLATYQWMLYGMLAYYLLRRLSFIRRNEEWMQTFSHELSHTIVSLLFFKKIHSFHVEENNGVVWHSGGFGGIFITLAPYCLPIFSVKSFFFFTLGCKFCLLLHNPTCFFTYL